MKQKNISLNLFLKGAHVKQPNQSCRYIQVVDYSQTKNPLLLQVNERVADLISTKHNFS